MDTKELYRNDPLLEVRLAERDETPNHHVMNRTVPIDGQISLLYRDPEAPQRGRKKDGRCYAGTFPFRDYRKDDHPWEAHPDWDAATQHPVWKWLNPNQDPDQITLEPNIKRGRKPYLHCWIKEGEIGWL